VRLLGPASDLPPHVRLSRDEQEAVILYEAARQGVQATFLAAIRIAENGGVGREFGILSVPAPTYEEQADVAARSVRNSLLRYVSSHHDQWPFDPHDHYTAEFIYFIASTWAPRGAENDPTHLNVNWPRNVGDVYRASGLER